MPDCTSIDPFVTPYVDGEIAAGDRQAVEAHIRACPPCRARVVRERAVRDLVEANKPTLHAACAPLALHARCAAARRDAPRVPMVTHSLGWRARLRPLAVAATLVLIVGAAFI